MGIFTKDEDDEDAEPAALESEGDVDADPECPAPDVVAPGDGAFRGLSSLKGAFQESGVKSWTPVFASVFPSG